MKKIILSIIIVSAIFGMGGAVLANTLNVEQRTSVENNVEQMVNQCKEWMGLSNEGDSDAGKTCNMEMNNANVQAPSHIKVDSPDQCTTEGQEKVID
ncbi:hypothetical protein [Bacillus sp. T3]|uniref:hypothetical protein n=1 Tax=Bacillus sp. T3 TaxID=467262 RepID=UPI002980C09A|nr:hypothetical protein [Bacillus sp. T3]